MRQIAIIGQTASGKSGLALSISKSINANILSLDSLSIYKEIDIASAKPNKEELLLVKHFGINEIYPNEKFSIFDFMEIYKKAKQISINDNKNLIIVGGSSFYLHSMIDGLSKKPISSPKIEQEVEKIMQNKENAYNILCNLDKQYMQNIKPNDTYRIEKAVFIYVSSGHPPSKYFSLNSKQAIIQKNEIEIFEIEIDKEELKNKITQRTNKMIKDGLIDEAAYLQTKYGKNISPINSIGLKESLEYLNGAINKKSDLEDKISMNTRRLAKRQKTFNGSKFKIKIRGTKDKIEKILT